MKKPPLDLKPGQVWEGSHSKQIPLTFRRIIAVDDRSVLWNNPGSYARNSTRAAFTKWAERLLP
jgi:hypothetical protein